MTAYKSEQDSLMTQRLNLGDRASATLLIKLVNTMYFNILFLFIVSLLLQWYRDGHIVDVVQLQQGDYEDVAEVLKFSLCCVL